MQLQAAGLHARRSARHCTLLLLPLQPLPCPCPLALLPGRVREALPPTFEEALQAAISSRQAAAAASGAAPAATRYRRVQVRGGRPAARCPLPGRLLGPAPPAGAAACAGKRMRPAPCSNPGPLALQAALVLGQVQELVCRTLVQWITKAAPAAQTAEPTARPPARRA